MRQERAEADAVFGARLKQARDDAGLSTLKLAEHLFLKRESVDRYMRGERRPSRDLVARWEELCGLDPGSLVDEYDRLPPRGPAAKSMDVSSAEESRSPDDPVTVDPDNTDAAVEAGATVDPQPALLETDRRHVDPPNASPTPRGQSRWPVGVLVVVGVLLVTATGFFVGRVAKTPRTADPPQSLATSRNLELRVPANWLRIQPNVALPRLGLSEPIVITADRPRGAGVIAGVSTATGAALLAPSTLRRLERRPRQDVAERLGTLDAYRYLDLKIRGFAGRLTLFVAPTSIGVVTLACFTPEADSLRFPRSCRSVAQSVRLLRGHSYPLGPSTAYQRSLKAVLAGLNIARGRHRAALKAAHSHHGQAAIADRLGTDFAVAHARAQDLDVSPRELGAHRQILRALTSTSRAYARLAAAARQESPTHFERAAKHVVRAERRVKTALRSLSRLGY